MSAQTKRLELKAAESHKYSKYQIFDELKRLSERLDELEDRERNTPDDPV